ncbi:MAG: aspartate kinase [Candidatus Bruticola sp.]
MPIIVQKFGGTSVASEKGWSALADKIKLELAQGNQVIVVVSAMGRRPAPYATDSLLGLIKDYASYTDNRERDMLMACGEIISAVTVSHYLRSSGIKAEAFDGVRAGISAVGAYGSASIESIDPSRLLEALQNGCVPIVAGFQGVNRNGDMVTLGRGGSDTTAVALGAAVKAERVDIFTDVEGVMTADPRFVPEAAVLDLISHAEVGEMANEGAKVLHPRSVEISQSHRVPLRVRSTFSSCQGTSIDSMPTAVSISDRHTEAAKLVTGVVSVPGYCMVSIDLQATPDLRARRLSIFERLAEASLSLDMINVAEDRICFLVNSSDINITKNMLRELGCRFAMRFGCAKLSVVGQAMRGQPGVMMRICRALADSGIELFYTTDSHITISAVVAESSLAAASRAVHREFQLG